MSFDVAVGMSGAQLNAAADSIYKALYPRVFTGSRPAQYDGVTFTVGIDVQAPPQFVLGAAQPARTVAQALTARAAAGRHGAPAAERGEQDTIIAAIAAAYPSFAMSLPAVALTLSNGTTTKITLAVTAQCYVENGPSTISFVPYSVTAPPQPDPVTNYLVLHVVLPAIQAMLTQLLAGVTIPPIEVENVPLSAPSVGIVNGYVIAAVNLAGTGTPPPPDGSFPWPGTPFFALLGPNLIQQLAVIAAASATNRFSDSSSGGDFWGGYHWDYGLSLTSPQASVQGSGVHLAFTLKGTVSAGVHVMWLPIDLGFDAYAEPDPAASASITIDRGQMVLTVQSVAAFTIFVLPNSVPTWVLGWLITAIINGVTLSLTPVITAFLKNIRVQSYNLPAYSVSIEGTTLRLTPANLSVSNVAGTIALTGDATIAPAREPPPSENGT